MPKTIKEERLRWILPISNKEIKLRDASKVCPHSQRSLDRFMSILGAVSRKVADEAGKMLVGYLNPQGQFTTVWDPRDTYTVVFSRQCAYTSEKLVEGLSAAIREMTAGQENQVDGGWAEVVRPSLKCSGYVAGAS